MTTPTPTPAINSQQMNLQTVHLSLFWANVGLTIFNSIPWVSIFLLLQFFGVRLYTIHDSEICKRIQKRLSLSTHMTSEGKGYGYALGCWYICNVSSTNDRDVDAWVIATAASYEALTQETNQTSPTITADSPDPPPSTLTIYERLGSFHHHWFKHRHFTTQFTPHPEQTAIIDRILEHQQQRDHTTVFLYGPPGTGKSMIGVLLAAKLGGSYCNTLKPWQPGDSVGSLYSEVEPTKEKPLVIAFDEVDGAIMLIHTGIADHKELPISVQNKAGWNRLFDEIGRGMYPHLIILLTSNREPEFIDGMDPSYIRPGRVNLLLHLADKVENVHVTTRVSPPKERHT